MSAANPQIEARSGGAPTDLGNEDDVVAIPLRRPWRLVSAIIVLLVFAGFIGSVATNPNIDFGAVGQFLFDKRILEGAWLATGSAAISMVVPTAPAVLVAAMRLSSSPVLSSVAWFYVWAFRGTPLLVQIVLWGYLGLLYEKLTLGVPFTDIVFWQIDTNQLISAFVAGLLALTLNQAAYSSEIAAVHVPSGAFAPGDARDHPADGQRAHLNAEEHLAALGHRRARAVHAGIDDLVAEPQAG